jgi:hypothetical protein
MSVVRAGAGAQGFSSVFRFVRCFLIAGCSANTNTRGGILGRDRCPQLWAACWRKRVKRTGWFA